MLQMKRIPVPKWARPFTATVDKDFGDQEVNRFSGHRDELWKVVQNAVEQYVNNDEVVSTEGHHLFPERRKLMGEYYIASENYYVQRSQDPRRAAECKLILSISVRCLERQWIENQTDFDYLGLELFFIWEPATQTYSYTGDVEPSSI